MLKIFKAFSDSQAKKRCVCFLKWRFNASKITSSKNAFFQKQAHSKLELEKHSELSSFEKNLAGQKSGIVQKQIESLLFLLSVDTLNGFLNL